MPLKKISFTLSIDAPDFFAALTQMGADVDVAFNGEPPRAKRHNAPKQPKPPKLSKQPKPLLLTDQSHPPKPPTLILAFLKMQTRPVVLGAIIAAVQKTLPNKTDAAIYMAVKKLRDEGMIAWKNKHYAITAKGAK